MKKDPGPDPLGRPGSKKEEAGKGPVRRAAKLNVSAGWLGIVVIVLMVLLTVAVGFGGYWLIYHAKSGKSDKSKGKKRPKKEQAMFDRPGGFDPSLRGWLRQIGPRRNRARSVSFFLRELKTEKSLECSVFSVQQESERWKLASSTFRCKTSQSGRPGASVNSERSEESGLLHGQRRSFAPLRMTTSHLKPEEPEN